MAGETSTKVSHKLGGSENRGGNPRGGRNPSSGLLYKDVAKGMKTIIGLQSYDGGKTWFHFTGNEDLMKIHEHWDNPMIWAIQDGYGIAGYTPVQGKDWSGVRDSSPDAQATMLEIAEKLQGRKPWPWEKALEFEVPD